ncbi:hypothetical protein [Bordetella sp. N]|uniref:hypothetical protein n=1 Tax=Bordetella sp. N TaxID=1746199 RepID=UPI00070D237F|nr:hypothetical protein [Bordetella sp. N]ALM83300.1 hypothetical protein ASB57_10270 [Bordetella sp. N]
MFDFKSRRSAVAVTARSVLGGFFPFPHLEYLLALDRVSNFSNAGGMTFSLHSTGVAPSMPPQPTGDPSLQRLAKLEHGEGVDLNAATGMDAGARPVLTRSYCRGGSLLSMSSAHVNRLKAEVTARLRKLQPWIHQVIDDLRVDMSKWRVDEIHIQGHVRGSRIVADQVAGMAKQYLVERGFEPNAIKVIASVNEVSTLGLTVLVFGRPK